MRVPIPNEAGIPSQYVEDGKLRPATLADAIDLLPARPQIKAGIGSEIVTQPVDRTSEEFLTFVYNTAHAYAAPDSPVFVAAVHVQGEGMTARTFTTRESKFETSSALETTPDSRRGILAQWQRLRARFYCTVCQTMQTVQSVNGIVQAPEHATYTGCVLECGHSRDISVPVQRT